MIPIEFIEHREQQPGGGVRMSVTAVLCGRRNGDGFEAMTVRTPVVLDGGRQIDGLELRNDGAFVRLTLTSGGAIVAQTMGVFPPIA